MKTSDFDKKSFSGLRKKAEEKLRLEKREQAKGSTPDIEHELNVYEMELKMQNEELLQAQSKLKSSLKEYEELFEYSPTGYFLLDKHGVVEKVNARGTTLLGVERSQIVGKPFSTFLNGEEHQDNFYRHRISVGESQELHHLETEIRRKDNTVLYVLLKNAVVKDEDLKFKHLLTITIDISDIREHEKQIELALRHSRELSDMKSRFITMASHEFRTPLATVLSSTSLLEQYTLAKTDDKIDKHINRIRTSVKDLTAILDEFLSLETLESGKVQISRSTFSLPEFCNRIIDEIKPQLKSGQRVNYRHVGDKEITEDKKIVQHIIVNLLSNACKYSNEEIVFLTEITWDKLIIRISDHGIGIPLEEQKNLFSRFFRARNVATIQGTGLGLNIVKRYVELINGTIKFTSRVNEGTTFVVEIPRINAG